MHLVHDRKLSTRIDSPQTSAAKLLAKRIKAAICVALAVIFAWAALAAEIGLMHFEAPVTSLPESGNSVRS